MSQFRSVSPAQGLSWYEGALEAIELHSLEKADVESIVRNPQSIELDPTTVLRDWHTERRRRGDVIVVVTFPDDASPIIWGVYVMSKTHTGTRQRRAPGSSGGAATDHNPTSLRELKRRLVAAGFSVESGSAGGSDRIYDPNGKFFWKLHATPSEYRSMINLWMTLRRKALTRGVEL